MKTPRPIQRSGHFKPADCHVVVHWAWEAYDDDRGGRWVVDRIDSELDLTPEEEEMAAEQFSPC